MGFLRRGQGPTQRKGLASAGAVPALCPPARPHPRGALPWWGARGPRGRARPGLRAAPCTAGRTPVTSEPGECAWHTAGSQGRLTTGLPITRSLYASPELRVGDGLKSHTVASSSLCRVSRSWALLCGPARAAGQPDPRPWGAGPVSLELLSARSGCWASRHDVLGFQAELTQVQVPASALIYHRASPRAI